ncbi:MAG: urease accessory protein UreF [Desulfovibrionaceae bacterium]|nr:urease accessory protein UreF [Desulfovibrionaceae bacterium]MBF0513397.1 urease accessory protein UreF [Desulfovibrionaceae bacterium]
MRRAPALTGSLALTRLLHLSSPALPVGAFAYSRGLEWVAAAGLTPDAAAVRDWILGLLDRSLSRLDAPVLCRLHAAFASGDTAKAAAWNDFLYASRETHEARLEDRQTGQALAKLLAGLGMAEAEAFRSDPRATFACLFALAAARWEIRSCDACAGYLFSWAENQLAAALKLGCLGQSAGQRILHEAGGLIPDAVACGAALADEDIGSLAPGQAMASALHETLETRLFRS